MNKNTKWILALLLILFAGTFLFLGIHQNNTQTPATQTPATQAPTTQAPATQTPETQAPVIRPTVGDLLEKYNLTDKVEEKDVLTVGNGKQFQQIQQAVNEAKNGAVIVVFSGIYEESVHAANKTLFIIGEDRKNCVITYPNENYHTPPLEMGSGLLANITVNASWKETAPNAIAPAYSLHIDFDISTNSSFDLIDVDFINDGYQPLGIGLRENFTLRFQNCYIECKSKSNAIFCHDDPTREGSKNQRLIVENCHFINDSATSSTILIQSQEENNSEIFCLWKNNVVENKGSGDLFRVSHDNEKISTEEGWHGASFWKNSADSTGNNIPQLNEP